MWEDITYVIYFRAHFGRPEEPYLRFRSHSSNPSPFHGFSLFIVQSPPCACGSPVLQSLPYHPPPHLELGQSSWGDGSLFPHLCQVHWPASWITPETSETQAQQGDSHAHFVSLGCTSKILLLCRWRICGNAAVSVCLSPSVFQQRLLSFTFLIVFQILNPPPLAKNKSLKA